MQTLITMATKTTTHDLFRRARFMSATALLFLLLLATSNLQAATSALESINYASMGGNQTQITLGFTGPVPTPKSFTVANPARITLDFPATQNRLQRRYHEVNLGGTQSISTAQASDRTRVVINLSSMSTYDSAVQGNNLILTVGNSSGAHTVTTMPAAAAVAMAKTYPTIPTPAPAPAPAPARVSTPQPASYEIPMAKVIPAPTYDPAPSPVSSYVKPTPQYSSQTVTSAPAPRRYVEPIAAKGISHIDFRRSDNGAGRVLVTLDDPNTKVDIRQQGLKIIASFQDTNIDSSLEQRLDVVDFATQVKAIDTRSKGGDTNVTVSATGNFTHAAYLVGNVYTIEVRKTETKKSKVKEKEVSYNGERLSLNFQSIEVRSVLQLIADFTGLNVVVSDDVGGEITLRLKDVPWDQALDIIMKTQGLDKRRQGNVLFIDKSENIRRREQETLKASVETELNVPLKTEIIALNYADAGEMSSLLKSGSTSNSIMSERGSVTIDKRTNSLLVQDTPAKLEEMRILLKRLDVPVEQVLIESRIVTASDNFTHELGVAFSGANSSSSSDNSLDSDFNISLGSASTAGSIGFNLAKLPGGASIDLELSAAQVEDRAEIVASPRIITSNKRKARIEQGVEIPYEEATSSGATNVSFKKAVLSLEVTPHITQDERINMELSVSKDSVGTTYNNVPSIDTREVETQVLVENGQTIVLGGIFEETLTSNAKKVPFFGDLPMVGTLFRRDSKRNDKSELLIFVTPKILNSDLSLR